MHVWSMTQAKPTMLSFLRISQKLEWSIDGAASKLSLLMLLKLYATDSDYYL